MYSVRKSNEETEYSKHVPQNQNTIYNQIPTLEGNPYCEDATADPPFLEWCKKILKSFRHKKKRRKTERWLPQLQIHVEKEITIDFKHKEISLNIDFLENTNTFKNPDLALRLARRVAKGLIETGETISIAGSTPGNKGKNRREKEGDFYTIDGQSVPTPSNLPALVNGRSNALIRLLSQVGVPSNQISQGEPIYNSKRKKPFAAIGTITSDKLTKKVKRKVDWELVSVPAGAGKHQLIKRDVKTKTADNR